MQRFIPVAVLACVILAYPASAAAIDITRTIYAGGGQFTQVHVDVAPTDSDDDGCPDLEDDFTGPGCSSPPPVPVTTPVPVAEPAPEPVAPVPAPVETVAPATAPDVVSCESGGDPNAVSADGAYWGLYQFDASTWARYAPAGAVYGSASAEEQAAAAAAVPYDAWPSC